MDPYLGQIYLFAYNWAPQGYALCDGSLVPIQQNQALFSLLTTVFGGNGSTNFGLPDLRGRVPRGWNPSNGAFDGSNVGTVGGALAPNYPLVATGTVAIAGNALPGHTHPATFTATTGSQTVTIPGNNASGAISVAAGAGIDVVPGAAGIAPASNGTYYLTGVKAPSAGPVTTTAPDPATKAKLQGLNISIDASSYQPAVPEKTASVTTVTGGSVTVSANNPAAQATFPLQVAGTTTAPSTAAAAAANLNPFLALNFSIAVMGSYPMRP